ncbi:AAA family ATPase [Gordonia sp. X0973]|uniref:LuxR C-terminal-related transcriptional regulator n=1 Tax=Gordonia sp. X0973 TaxID=2742602 RepID=UPI000F525CB3|nr:LuxR family transcriptional regulator [Gordonia sp. X0973]QKT06043.1 AAA family ATPase [Gordonia sp. X0973]
MVDHWPLTGRENELDALLEALKSGARSVIVTGDAGVGKSRLLEELAAQAKRRVIRITGFAATRDIPFGATSSWLGTAPPDPALLIESVLATIAGDRTPGTAPPLVLVDDAQWLDDVSATVVNRLASRRLASVVVALRTLSDAPDPIVAMHRDPNVDHLPLASLSVTETEDLLAGVLGGRLHRQTAQELWKLTSGNLLYVREITTADVASGKLARDAGGEWVWDGGPSVADSLTELIGAQLGRLDETTTELVDVLAIAGTLGVDALGSVHGLSTADVERAVADHLVVVDAETGTARLVHPLYAEVRLQRMGRLRRSRLQSAVADALGAHPSGNPRDAMLRAVAAMESGAAHDPGLYLAGAAAASAWCDLDLTLTLARAAIDAGGGFPAEMMLAYHLTTANQGAEADRALAALLARPDLSPDQTMLLAYMYAGNRFWVMQRPDEAERILADAIAAAEPDTNLSTLISLRGAFASYLGHHDDALRLTAEALEDPSLIGMPHIFCAMGRTISLGAMGHYTRLDEFRRRAHEDAAISVPGSIRYTLMTLELQAHAIAGDLTTATEIADTYSTEADDLPGFARTLTTYMRGYAAYFRGEVTEATDCIRGVVARLADDPRATPGWEYACRNRLAALYAMAGNTERAAEHHAWIADHPHPAIAYVDTELLVSRGWAAAAAGQVSQAIACAGAAAELARDRGESGNEVLALQHATQWGDASTAVRLAELAHLTDGPRPPLAARHARALADRDADGLWECSHDWTAMGDSVAAVDAAAQAAVLFRAADRRGQAQLAGDAAARTAADRGFSTPALRAMTAPAELTRREAEIVAQVAQGLSNREIADRLGLSSRTVEGHIYRAMTKTDCSNRSELAALIDERHDSVS